MRSEDRLGIIRDIRRKIEGQPAPEEAFALPLGRATQIRSQQQRQRGFKLYSFHAPEAECIKAEGHLGRCFLKGRAGDAANVVLSAVGHNFRRILAWLRDFWRLILTALIAAISVQSASDQLLNGRLKRSPLLAS
jgi:hypothetical protein